MTQSDDFDRIRQLTEAARAEERAKLAVEALLREIHEELSCLKRSLEEFRQEIVTVRSLSQANYANVATLIQLMAAIWQGDRSALTEIQQRIAEQVFTMSDKGEGAGISVEAQGDVNLSADKVGRDKHEGK